MPAEIPKTNIVPDQPKTFKPIVENLRKDPPKEILNTEFKVDNDFFKSRGELAPVQLPTTEKKDETTTKETVKPTVETKETVEVKEEPKSSLSVLKAPAGKEDKQLETAGDGGVEASAKPTVKKITPAEKKVDKRDYTGFSTEEVSLLKQMSNEAFEYTTKLLKENKSKNDFVYQHPEAYTLTPDYTQTRVRLHLANVEANYWKQALIDCKAGKPVIPLTGFKGDTGEPIFGEKIEPSDELEEAIRSNYNAAINGARQFQANVENIKNSFTSKVKTDLNAINQERANRFAWVSDPKLMDYTVSVNGTELPLKKIKSDFVSLFPKYLQNDVGVEVAADLMIAMTIQSAELEEARSGKNLAETKQKEIQRAEPGSSVKPRSEPETIGGVKEFSLAGMPT